MKLIIFDCDGTIVDSQHAIAAAMSTAFQEHGLKAPARAQVLGVVGLSLVEAIERLLPEAVSDEAAEIIAHSYKRTFTDLRRQPDHQEPLFEGAADALARLAARDDVVLGIATGKSRRGVDVLFEREGLGAHFVTIQTADNHPSKPHPSMIEQAMLEVGAAPEETVMIGDTTYDIEMACAAEVAGLGVEWGYHPKEMLLAAGAREIVSDYALVADAADRLLKSGGNVT